MLRCDIKITDMPHSENLFNIRPSIKQRLKSLRKRSKNESPLEYFPMEFIGEEKQDSSSMTTEVLKNEIRKKLLDAVRYLGVQEIFQEMETNELKFDLFENSSRAVKNLAFLWSAFVGRLDYMQIIHDRGADLEFSFEIENYDALHLSALGGSECCCEWLLSKGFSFRKTNQGLLPLHFAVLGNSRNIAELFINYGCEIPDTVLNSAAYGNSLNCVDLLLSQEIGVNTFDKDGMTPLHIASDHGNTNCVKQLLNHPLIRTDIKTDDERKYTALHLAAESGYDECIRILIAQGANVNELSAKKETPLHLACKMHHPDCVDVLLKNNADNNIKNADERTPLHVAVSKSRLALPIVQMLVEWQANVNASDWYGFTPLHLAALNELDECVEYLIMNGSNIAAKTKAGLTALNVINRKTPISASKIVRRLNLSLAYNAEQSLKFSFRDILSNSLIGEVGYLYILQKEGQAHVLKHPLCRAFLHLKWQKIRPYYLLRVGISIIAIALLSLYIMIASANGACALHRENNNGNCYENGNSSCVKNQDEKNEIKEQLSIFITLHNQPVLINSIKIAIALLLLLNFLRIFVSLAAYKSAKHYFSKRNNILELFIIISSIILCSKSEGHFNEGWQCVLGAVTVLFSWVYLMIMVGQMPSFGPYVSMFAKVLQEFSKLLLAYFCLLLGFTITLSVLFPQHTIFKNPIIGFVKVMAMMTGELNLDDLASQLHLNYKKFTAFFVLALFVIFVTVVLMNLLVGIAVHDVEGLHKTADLTKLVHQTQLVHFLELACFNSHVPKNISEFFQTFLYVSPKMYKVVIYVRPLCPHEKRLPKEIMEEGLKIALDRRKARSMKNNSKQDMESRIESLENEIKKLQNIMTEMNINMKNSIK